MSAGSSLVQLGARLAVVQDDASCFALVDPNGASVCALTFADGERQQDKLHKLDLEAAAVVDDALWAFGSGSAPARERIVVVEDGTARVVDASRLYAALRAHKSFSGTELNVEGALAEGVVLRLFNRGNGAPGAGRVPTDATIDLELSELRAFLADPADAPVPELCDAVEYDLGRVAGIRLTFTDAAAAEGHIFYVAAAEDSPDAFNDGPVAGVAIGLIPRRGEPRYAMLLDEDGGPFRRKAEGLCFVGRRAFVVIDIDDADKPSELCEVSLGGPWFD